MCANLYLLFGVSSLVSARTDTTATLEAAPSRQSVMSAADTTTHRSLKVTNNSDRPIDVSFRVEEFTVNAKTHTISFKPPTYDWIRVTDPQVKLAPHEKTRAHFIMSVPPAAASGEYYFALIASTESGSKTVQVASLVYLYVNGDTARRDLNITTATSFPVIIGGPLRYTYSLKNSGNIHAAVTTTERVTGPSYNNQPRQQRYIILPNRARAPSATVAPPFWPGVYQLRVTAREEASDLDAVATQRIVYVPVWSLVALLLVALLSVWAWQHRKR